MEDEMEEILRAIILNREECCRKERTARLDQEKLNDEYAELLNKQVALLTGRFSKVNYFTLTTRVV